MKRGVSPLIAWVLLVGFAVVMGAFIFTWTRGTLTDLRIGESQEKELYCEGVSFSIDYVCKDVDEPDKLHAKINNKGNYAITAMTISLDFNDDQPQGYCYRSFSDLMSSFEVGGVSYTYEMGLPLVYLDTLLVGVDDQQGLTSTDCTDGTDYDNKDLAYLGLVPWITIEEESFPCTNKQVIIDGTDERPDFDKDFLNVESCEIPSEN